MQTYNDCKTTYPKSPVIGDFMFTPLFGVWYYFSRDGKWRDNLIIEENGDEFEIIRLQVVPPPEDFELTAQ